MKVTKITFILMIALNINFKHQGGFKSFADDLNKVRGAVRGRVALLLRSAEA